MILSQSHVTANVPFAGYYRTSLKHSAYVLRAFHAIDILSVPQLIEARSTIVNLSSALI